MNAPPAAPIWRPPAAYVHPEPTVSVPWRVAAWLERYADLRAVRTKHRGADGQVDSVLVALGTAAASWRQANQVPVAGTAVAETAEPVAVSALTTAQAADLVSLSDRAVRKAAAEGRLVATKSAGSWRIRREDLEHYRAARAR